MKCKKNHIILHTLSFLLLISPAFADPSPGIKTLMNTPASTWDLFLHKIYIASNGNTFFGHSKQYEQPEMIRLDYDYQSNIIEMVFHIHHAHELMRSFETKNIEEKKLIMLRIAKNVAESMGLEATEGLPRLGLIQILKIRNGWGTRDFDESKIKEEIIARSVLEMIYAWEKKLIYKVRRTQDGKYEFSIDTKTIKH